MDHRYKIIISNNNVYKEIELAPDMQQVKVGTGIDCDVRLSKQFFFGGIDLFFVKQDGQWVVLCSDNLYLTVGDIRKLMKKDLSHGETVEVKYQESDNYVFSIEFLIDFNDGKRKYERSIQVSDREQISIGYGYENTIVLKSPYMKKDTILLKKKSGELVLVIKDTTYGVYHNGRKAKNNEIIRNLDFLSIVDFFFYYKEGKLWTEIREDMQINALSYTDKTEPVSYPKFNRNTRIKTVISDEKIEILDPPAKPQKPKNNLLMRLLPFCGMLAVSGIMAFMGGTMIIFSAISGVLAIVTSIIGMRENNKEFKKTSAERIEKYNSYIEKKKKEIELYRKQELQELEEMYISQNKEESRLMEFSSELFDRTPEDEDFLCVRLGEGSVEAKREINYKKQERLEVEDELQEIPEQIFNKYKYIQNAPIACDLKAANAIGIVGVEEYRFELLKNMIIDIAARQYFSDVGIVLVADKTHKNQIHWLRMLPHVSCEQLGTRMLVTEDESKNLIFEYLYKEMTFREQNKTNERHLVVFFYDEYGFKNHPISRFVNKAKDLRITFVFFSKEKKDIPMGCSYIVDIKNSQSGKLICTEDRGKSLEFTYPKISNEHAQEIVKILAPVYTEEISLEGTLTKNVSMFEMLNILAVDDLNLAKRWGTSQVFKSMSAPLGVSKTGIVNLDLHDKAHGPHGLVAGTTGSGKSEILQTYILAMSTLYHPYEVGFVIIDFKGGGMVNQFKDLPHLLGTITNIDGKEIHRSLKSIKAELQKRQRLFADAEVNHIDKYIKKFKEEKVEIALPHLIIIVDEFAELKAEQPEFMKELISAARIGRSLGVHLILATQKPSGQVNEQIWSNSRFKLCLKVQSQEDSNEVIKSPLAAEIKEPGRAYLQVGNNEIFELFQSAYSGAPEKEEASNRKEFTIYAYSDSGKKVPVYVQKKQKAKTEDNRTQLDAIVNYVNTYCKKMELRKLPDICLPSLKTMIRFPEEGKLLPADYNVYAEIGIFDDPDHQYQGTYAVDLANQNLMIIGSAQSGKTNILQNIIRSLATKYTPDEVNIYIMDFASMVLKNFETLNHVGGVVTSSEDEKLKNLMKLLYSEIEQRKEKLWSVGVSSFTAYKEAGKTDLPQIVLMIDNLTALKELYFQEDEELLTLCREGLTVGISVIIANGQTSRIGYKYLSNFSSRIALFCNDQGEYSSLFDHCREKVEDIQGRCLVEIDKEHLECQAFLAFEGEKEIQRVEKMKEFISAANRRMARKKAKIIPVIPEILSQNYIIGNFGRLMQDKYNMVLGLDYASVSPCILNLNGCGAFAIAGRENMGQNPFVEYLISMAGKIYGESTEVHIVDSIQKPFAALKELSNVKSYEYMPDKAPALLKQTEEVMKERYQALVAGDDQIIANSNMHIVVLNGMDAIEAVSNDRAALDSYKNIINRYKNMNVCIFVCGYANAAVSYNSPEFIKLLRDGRQFLFFDDLTNMKIIDLPLATMRNYKKPIVMGDCYFIRENECMKLKTVLKNWKT